MPWVPCRRCCDPEDVTTVRFAAGPASFLTDVARLNKHEGAARIVILTASLRKSLLIPTESLRLCTYVLSIVLG